MDLELYARILAELARGQAQLDDLLARFGIDEANWAPLSASCDAALEISDEGDDTTALERFATAFARAQAELAGGPAPFEEWLEVLAALQKGEALPSALERSKLPLDRYLATQAHWAQRAAKDPELNARLQAVLATSQRR